VVTSDLDIYRTVNLLMQQYGPDDAPIIAAKRTEAFVSLGDLDGQRVWKSVSRAIGELRRAQPRTGEHVH
jgi:hypothetical protein